MPPQVDRQHLVTGREFMQERMPHVPAVGDAVDEDERRVVGVADQFVCEHCARS